MRMRQKLLNVFAVLFCSGFLHADLAPEPVDAIVLGGGVGALTSAIYLSRSGFAPVLIEGNFPGGALTQSSKVQNWPGEIEISGVELTEKIRSQALQNGVRILPHEVVSVDFHTKPFVVTTQDILDVNKKKTFTAPVCIVALGSKPNALGIPGEADYWARGVYTCAVCDGSLYKGKTVAVVGGGDAAVLEAEYLSQIADRVYLIVRKPKLKGLEVLRAEALLSNPKVVPLFNTTVSEIKGNEFGIQEIRIKNEVSEQEETLPLHALFLAIGAKPNTQLLSQQLELDKNGYIVLKNDMETSIPGVYALGDIVDPIYKQAISAAGDGAKAAIQAQKYAAMSKTQNHQQDRSKTKSKQPLIIEITSVDQFHEILRTSSVPVYVDFYATWCGPCKALHPYFETWGKDMKGKALFCKVNVDHFPELSSIYQVRAMPTMIVFQEEGKEKDRKVGGRDIVNYMEKMR